MEQQILGVLEMSKARGPYRVDPLGYKKANEALDKKAENARELGLDYEPAQQEPVAWVCYGSNNKLDIDFFDDEIADLAVGTMLYTHAQRTWVSLTDEELSVVYNQADWDTVNGWEYERAIEAKLKEKNT